MTDARPLAIGGALIGVLAVISAAVAGGPADEPVRPFTFGLWGDLPYARADDGPKIPALIADMNDADLAFTAFDGDINDGVSPCADDVYPAAAAIFNRLEAPTVYVPGDNEWTDCHRLSNGGYQNLERLAHLRRVMFSATDSFGARQAFVAAAGSGARALETFGSPNADWVKVTADPRFRNFFTLSPWSWRPATVHAWEHYLPPPTRRDFGLVPLRRARTRPKRTASG